MRNPLTAVRLDLERSARKLPDDADGAVELTKRALAEIDRLNASVSGFLRVARSGSPTFRTMDLHGPVEAAVHAAAPRLDERGCTVRLERPSGPLTVRGDGGSLEQLILNLLLNAAEASPAGGVVRLFAESTPRGVRVGVEDQGPGVAPEDRDRIFEPFFTTKGEGTGLGLAVARRIARAHGSELEVASGSQGGALFSFLLPTETHGRIGS